MRSLTACAGRITASRHLALDQVFIAQQRGRRQYTRLRTSLMATADGATALPRLTYFDGRGHGQRVRYALAGAGLKWTEHHLKKPGDMDAAREHCLFGQVPLLEIDGFKLVQSWAIVRYMAAKEQLPPERAWVADACAEQVRDWYTDAGFVGFGWSANKAPGLAKVFDAATRYLPQFEQALCSSFLTGEAPCWADYQLLLALDYTVELLGDDVLAPFTKCRALRNSLHELPHMKEFYASEHNKGLVDQRYMAEVRAAMSPINQAKFA